MKRLILATVPYVVLGLFVAAIAMAQSTQPASPASQPTISPAAKAVLDDLRDAYSRLDSLALAGTVSIDFEAAGKSDHKRAEFTGTFQSASKFRHEMKDDILIVSTGEKLISYLVSKNQYYSNESPKQKSSELPDPVKGLLQEQNPSLYLALVPDAAKELADGTSAIEKLDDVQLAGGNFQAMKLTQEDRDIRVLIDPKTHLLRQMQIDLTKLLKQQEVPLVNKALVTIDYTASTPGAGADAAAFVWTPPQGATQLKPQAADAGDLMGDAGDDENASQKLVGQPAPAFTLDDLDGKKVAIADQKGSVVVLDFWATWCPPCREGLPHLDELYKAKQADGVKVFAINLREDRDKAKAFLDSKNLSLPVLLDANGEVGKAYLVGGIPQTVVIGKDGVVKRVLVGFGDGSAQALEQTVVEALRGK